jgi:predicted phage terminase large subunit-like protein
MVATVRVRPIPISRPQQQVIESPAWLTGFVAGRGAGKTVVGAIRILRTARAGQPWMAVSPDYNMIRQTTLPTFIASAKRSGQYLEHVTTPTPRVTFRTLDGGIAEIVFKGAEKPDKLRGASVAGIWFDEASIISKAAFDIAIACCRHEGKMGPVLCTFTPRGFRHWTFEQFFSRVEDEIEIGGDGAALTDGISYFQGRAYRQLPNTHLVKCATRDNPFAPPEFDSRIRANYSSMLAQQELEGDYVEISGLMFRREWFQLVDEAPLDALRFRYWDRAYLPGSGCYTAGVLMSRAPDGLFYVEHVVRGQWGPHERNRIIAQTAERDAQRYFGNVTIYVEHEGSGASKEVTDNLIRSLANFPIYADLASLSASTKTKGGILLPGDAKIRRAMPLSAQCEAGNVRIVRGAWNADFIDELGMFPEYTYCDQVDAASACYQKLAKVPPDGLFARRLGVAVDQSHYGKIAQLSDNHQPAKLGELPWNKDNSEDPTGYWDADS